MSNRGLSAIRATAATVGGFPLLAVLIYVADEHPAVEAGAESRTCPTVRELAAALGVEPRRLTKSGK